MNRSRVGLAALLIGAGAVVRQRMKRQRDPGVDGGADLIAADAVRGSAAPDAVASPLASSFDDAVVADSAFDASVEVSLGDPDIDGVVAPLLGDPEIDGVGADSLGDVEVELEAALPSAADVDIDVAGSAVAASSLPAAAMPGFPAADIPPVLPTADTIPAIVLPTIPGAGTEANTVETISNAAPAQASAERPTAATVPPAVALSEPVKPAAAVAPITQITAPSADVAGVADVGAEAATVVPDSPKTQSVEDAVSVEKEPFHRAHRGWSIAGSVFLGLVVVALIAGSVVRLPYYSLEPGSVYDTIERVEAPGDLVSIPSGEIGFVTVSQTANITPWQWLDAKLDNNVRIRHEDEVRGDQTADELRAADIRRMTVSKNSAVVVALQKLGFDLVITPIGIEVAQVFDCTAADGTLGTGDLIVGVNGVEVLTGEQLVSELMGQSVGATVDLLIERIDPTNPTQSMRTDLVAVTLGSADAACLPDDVRAEEPRPFIGIGTLPIFDEEFPIDIDVRTGTISGPSAGLAFTLAIMDVLSEGELTNGLSVVATGSIDRDGNVGPVGGIHQKTIAAERSGADVFIVPRCCDNFVDRTTGEPLDLPGNYEEALLHAEDMIVIGVDTLDEALIALGELGGDVEPFLTPEAP